MNNSGNFLAAAKQNAAHALGEDLALDYVDTTAPSGGLARPPRPLTLFPENNPRAIPDNSNGQHQFARFCSR